MKILYLTLGSQSGVVEYIAKEFAKKNISVDILDVSRALSFRSRRFRFPSLKLRDLTNSFLSIIQFGREWKKYFKFTDFAFRTMTTYAESFINKNRYDMILQAGAIFAPSHNHLSLPYALYIDHTHKISQSYVTNEYLKPPAHVSVSWMEMEGKVYKNASLIFSMSNNVKKSLMNDYGISEDKIVVVGAGPNFDGIPSDFDKRYDNKRILFIGDNFLAKGGDVLMKAFRLVKKEIPDTQLAIVGCKPDISEGGVGIKGWLNKEDLIREYKAASLFVLPTFREAFGISFLEAMAYKLPCIGSNIEAIPEIIDEGKTGFTVPVNDPALLSKKILLLLRNKNLIQQMGGNGYKKIIERFNWGRVVDNIYRHLSDLPKAIIND